MRKEDVRRGSLAIRMTRGWKGDQSSSLQRPLKEVRQDMTGIDHESSATGAIKRSGAT